MKKQTRKSREDVRDLPLKVKAEMALKEGSCRGPGRA